VPTALITGASSGIGEEFARRLADRGYSLVLVARRRDRLERLAGELPTTAHPVECDLGTEAGELAGRVAELGVEVDLLVNNAGFGLRGRFRDLPVDRQAEMVRVNCEAVVTLTGAFLPGMLERRGGGIIVVASTAGMQPLPYEAVYGASKAFALNFAEALHAEVKGKGVRVLAVNPGPVPTEWQQVAGYDAAGGEMMPGAIEAGQVVREALEAYDKGRRTMVPGRFFRNFMRVNAVTPRAVKLVVSERMYRPKK
jgi:short-subunit dehydrogenase